MRILEIFFFKVKVVSAPPPPPPQRQTPLPIFRTYTTISKLLFFSCIQNLQVITVFIKAFYKTYQGFFLFYYISVFGLVLWPMQIQMGLGRTPLERSYQIQIVKLHVPKLYPDPPLPDKQIYLPPTHPWPRKKF